MHSTGAGPSHSERGSGLPRMWWPLSRIQVVLVLLPILLVPVLLDVRGQWRRSEQCQRVRQQRKAPVVAGKFVSGIHACPGGRAHACSQQCRESSEAT